MLIHYKELSFGSCILSLTLHQLPKDLDSLLDNNDFNTIGLQFNPKHVS